MRREPEVYASAMGEDSSTLYVPIDHYPTQLGALRAVNASPWADSARYESWRYAYTGEITAVMHTHGPDEGTYDPDSGAATCCGPARACHVFEVQG